MDHDGLIRKIHERRSVLARGDEFSASLTEVLVANADCIFVVMSLNQDFNVRKLRWFLIAAAGSGAQVVLILTKADLNSPAVNEEYLKEARRITDVPILVTRRDDPDSAEPIRQLLWGGRTGALLGASGVGKSTLINLILKEERMETGGIRESDDQGRHTTTRREIIVLQGIGCLIDTPGLRRIRLKDEGAAVDDVFGELKALMAQCRYRDCSHEREPGCAVQAAIAAGTISPSDLKDYRSMLQEARLFDQKAKARERSLKKKERDRKKPRRKNWAEELE